MKLFFKHFKFNYDITTFHRQIWFYTRNTNWNKLTKNVTCSIQLETGEVTSLSKGWQQIRSAEVERLTE